MTVGVAAVLALTAVFLSLYLKAQQKEIATLLMISVSVLLFGMAVKEAGKATVSIQETVAASGVALEVETLLKALGIAALTQITADICREAGEGTVAGQVELVGRIEIVVLSLPLASNLLMMARGLLS